MTAPVWLLEGGKPGDTQQLLNIADRLSVPYLRRRLVPKPRWVTGKPPFLPSLYPFDRNASDPLLPPWPELILVSGRRPTMAALWIQKQSGGRTRLVILGRPKGYRRRFALILAPPQALVPPAPDVLSLESPLFLSKPPAVPGASETALEAELAALPRPLTAVMLGGATRPYRFDEGVLAELLRCLKTLPRGAAGTLYFCGSRRTPAAILDALDALRPAGSRLYRWREGDAANPYGALRRGAEAFVATSDSASMLMELSGEDAPLWIYRLPKAVDWRERLERAVARFPRLARVRQRAVARGWLPSPRDLDALAHAVVRSGAARFLNPASEAQAAATSGPSLNPERALARAVAAVEGLLSGANAGLGKGTGKD